ncbi:MAG: MerR family transcriptional regulator [Asticcacaulis sp.]
MTRYTVKQLADLARISVRTLHHYDDVGLLKPAYLGHNGYRYYEQPQLYRLQQVLMYREFGLALDEIKAILDAPGFDVAQALHRHRERLIDRLQQQQELLRVIDNTLARIGGEKTMQDNKLYEWNSGPKQAEYEQWLIERYGPQAQDWLDTGRKRFAELDEAEKAQAMQRLAEIEGEMTNAFKNGVAADAVILSPLMERHREWVSYMWGRPCVPVAYGNLGDLYTEHADFIARFDSMAPGLSSWLAVAMKAHASRLGAAA